MILGGQRTSRGRFGDQAGPLSGQVSPPGPFWTPKTRFLIAFWEVFGVVFYVFSEVSVFAEKERFFAKWGITTARASFLRSGVDLEGPRGRPKSLKSDFWEGPKACLESSCKKTQKSSKTWNLAKHGPARSSTHTDRIWCFVVFNRRN